MRRPQPCVVAHALLSAVIAVLAAGTANAAPILAVPFAVGPGDSQVTFDEVVLAEGQSVIDEFAAFGVTFSPNVYAETLGRPTTGFSGQNLANFGNGPRASPFEVRFTNDVTRAGAFFEFDVGTSHTFAALLDGSVVESFLYVEPLCCESGTFLGFQAIVFDAIRVSAGGVNSALIFDDLRFTEADATVVPEPASLLLVGMGGLGLLAKKRRRRKQAQ